MIKNLLGLFYSTLFFKGNVEILQLLIDRDAHINAINRNNHTALDAALRANENRSKLKNNCDFQNG